MLTAIRHLVAVVLQVRANTPTVFQVLAVMDLSHLGERLEPMVETGPVHCLTIAHFSSFYSQTTP